jgi:UDP-N-acetylmuramoyl-L-alanyl-D-glutamate--2,6-diaminopimelate ligase
MRDKAMKLEQILQNIKYSLKGDINKDIREIIFDSRQVKKDDLFVAIKGTKSDGHAFIEQAIASGASSIMCEEMPDNISGQISYIKVDDANEALGLAAANFYGHPSRKLKLVGVTGTNGKTSIVTLSHRLFSEFGFKVGLLSTVRNLIGQKEYPATHTTPDSLTIQRMMKEMVDAGCEYAFMEVSSHSIDQKRIAALDFDGAVFTNITHDHLDYHKTFDAYIRAKKQFFDGLSANAFALVNNDDKHASVMVQNAAARVKTFGLRSMADFKVKIIESHFDGMLITIDNTELWCRLIGNFNASNLLAVYAIAILLGREKSEVLKIISTLQTVEGRFEYVRSANGITAIIDYAHTPDALMNVIQTINQIRNESCKLITVVGAGGDRDKTKRPIMGSIAAESSTRVILTSDNPRSEDPQVILDEMYAGVGPDKRKNVLVQVDRREAIRTAVMMAEPEDVILIAGKGHENYQEIKGVKSHFSDKEVVSEIFTINKINMQ